ncbi:hypothetical protein DWW36_00775 [Erysipelotrichaceae bacterium AF15-26LB]|nr:hypothetical protein DWX45_05600 [Erysipelotrichaceae bacterium AF19-24AC]RJV92983.1 hypothetical protein DWW36_00775 [Erysipelotrichaceae bacterium AF15-26LB]
MLLYFTFLMYPKTGKHLQLMISVFFTGCWLYMAVKKNAPYILRILKSAANHFYLSLFNSQKERK